MTNLFGALSSVRFFFHRRYLLISHHLLYLNDRRYLLISLCHCYTTSLTPVVIKILITYRSLRKFGNSDMVRANLTICCTHHPFLKYLNMVKCLYLSNVAEILFAYFYLWALIKLVATLVELILYGYFTTNL
jgi:hypothetical protein